MVSSRSSAAILVVDVDTLSTPATLALRTLIQLNPESYGKYIHLLSQSLGEIHSSPARAEIIWLVGEYASHLDGRAVDILRLSLIDFAEQVPNLHEIDDRMTM
jgi:AP-3 complex subunit beta